MVFVRYVLVGVWMMTTHEEAFQAGTRTQSAAVHSSSDTALQNGPCFVSVYINWLEAAYVRSGFVFLFAYRCVAVFSRFIDRVHAKKKGEKKRPTSTLPSYGQNY